MSEPDFVEVRDEPFHRHAFENRYVRAYDVLIPPGEASLFHRHLEDTFYAIVTDVELRDQVFGQKPGPEGSIPSGLALCRPHRAEPLIHRVTNIGAEGARMIGAEVKQSPPTVAKDAIDAPGHALRFEVERLRAYDLSLDPDAGAPTFEYAFTSLTVALSRASLLVRDRGGLEQTVSIAPGDLVWREDPTDLTVRNVGSTPYRAVLAEWR